MAAVIVNFCQVSPVNLFLGLIDNFDRPTSGSDAQGLDFDDSLSTRIIWRKVKQIINLRTHQIDRMKKQNLST